MQRLKRRVEKATTLTLRPSEQSRLILPETSKMPVRLIKENVAGVIDKQFFLE
ncbi:hypothetical protein DPMN_015413 [Dreissena polymorpha]|uniref:Uncharacterized protein n=1 Tax=Dreissena polymorpha TaxID=45954 RepID=A0A9D4NCR9_DREPO|nr:hypothetical protein DPMN_015413 [Dreissena polymorpha]